MYNNDEDRLHKDNNRNRSSSNDRDRLHKDLIHHLLLLHLCLHHLNSSNNGRLFLHDEVHHWHDHGLYLKV